MDTSTATSPQAQHPLPQRLRSFDDLPGPRGLPVLGNLLQVDSTRLHLQLEAWCLEFGPLFKLKLGKRQVLVVGDHTLIAQALRDRPEGFRRTQRLAEVSAEIGLLPGVFGANGEVWRRQRRMVMAGFDPGHLQRYFPSLQQVAARLAGRWQRAARQGQDIDLLADLMRYTVDTIAGLAFGAEVNTLESDADVIQNHLNRIIPMLFKRLFSPLPWWRWWPSAQDKALQRSVVEVNAAVDGFITQARAHLAANPDLREHPRNLLEAMLVAADQPGSGMDDAQVAGNVMVMLLAGEDTTANTIAWMVHLLWQHPTALARASEEVRRVCGDARALTPEQVGQLDFVEACAHETMRLKPVAPQNAMQALRDTVLGDVQVKTGMIVMAVMRHDSVSEQHVPQADQFLPERWLAHGGPASQGNSAKRISMPFGAGPRVCPGRHLAMLEMKVALATLLGRFDIAHVGTSDGAPPRELLQLAMAPVGLRMRLRERTALPAEAAQH